MMPPPPTSCSIILLSLFVLQMLLHKATVSAITEFPAPSMFLQEYAHNFIRHHVILPHTIVVSTSLLVLLFMFALLAPCSVPRK